MNGDVHLLREIYDSKSALAVGLATCLAIFFVGLLGAFLATRPDAVGISDLVGPSSVMLVSALIAWRLGLRLARATAPVVAMDEAGIFDRRISLQFFRWAEVIAVRPWQTLSAYGVMGALLEFPITGLTGATFSHSRLLGGWWRFRRWTGASTFHVPVSSFATHATGQQLYEWCLAYSRTYKFEVDKENV